MRDYPVGHANVPSYVCCPLNVISIQRVGYDQIRATDQSICYLLLPGPAPSVAMSPNAGMHGHVNYPSGILLGVA